LAFRILESGYLPEGTDWHFAHVRSPFWRIYHNGAPGWNVRHAGRKYPLGPDHLLLIPDETLFDCIGDRGVPHLWIHFTPPLESTTDLAGPHTVALDETLQNIVAELVARHAARRDARLVHTAAALLHMAFARLEHAPVPIHPPRLEELLRFIEENVRGNLSNEQLARRTAMSQSGFIRWFAELTKTTPAAWVQAARIKEASRLLALSDSSIDEIAAECGFPNRYYFSRVFRQHQGCGPAEYRKRQVR
jgi:AraC-like DNA-binding protein